MRETHRETRVGMRERHRERQACRHAGRVQSTHKCGSGASWDERDRERERQADQPLAGMGRTAS